MTPDFINGLFQLSAGVVLTKNVFSLHKDKQLKGVSKLSTVFMVLWGVWTLYFYYSAGHVWSFIGGLVVTFVYFVWIGQMIYYSYFLPRIISGR